MKIQKDPHHVGSTPSQSLPPQSKWRQSSRPPHPPYSSHDKFASSSSIPPPHFSPLPLDSLPTKSRKSHVPRYRTRGHGGKPYGPEETGSPRRFSRLQKWSTRRLGWGALLFSHAKEQKEKKGHEGWSKGEIERQNERERNGDKLEER